MLPVFFKASISHRALFVSTKERFMDPTLISQITVASLIGLTLLSLFPVDLRKYWNVSALYYPLAALIVMALYEAAIQSEVPAKSIPIRIDLLILRPIMAFIVLSGVTRWVLLAYMRLKRPKDESFTGRPHQLIAVVALGLASFIWFCSGWW